MAPSVSDREDSEGLPLALHIFFALFLGGLLTVVAYGTDLLLGQTLLTSLGFFRCSLFNIGERGRCIGAAALTNSSVAVSVVYLWLRALNRPKAGDQSAPPSTGEGQGRTVKRPDSGGE